MADRLDREPLSVPGGSGGLSVESSAGSTFFSELNRNASSEMHSDSTAWVMAV